MTISDLVVPLLALPLRLIQELSPRPGEWLVDGSLGNALCKLCFFITDISPAVSVLSLVAISVNRFIVTTFPIRRQIYSYRTNKILIASIWFTAMAFFSPYFYTFRLRTTNGYAECVYLWSPAFDDLSAHTIYTSIDIVSFFIIPFIVIIFLYAFIMRKLHKNSVDMADMLNHDQLISRRRKNKQIILMSLVIIIVFGLLWGPYYMFFLVINCVWRWDIPSEVLSYIGMIAFVVQYLGFLNSAVNPCIYFVFLKNYRNGLKCLFWKNCLRNVPGNFPMQTLGSFRFTAPVHSSGSRLAETKV
jgi:phosphoglycerol transferase MdoB-like AlkP superfamily enzyme